MNRLIFMLSLLTVSAMSARAQGFVETDYLSSSDMNDKEGVNYGSGDMLRVKGRYTLPLSVKKNERGQATAWSTTLSASYATMNNKGMAQILNPDELLNASVNVSHTRPLSSRWQLIASLGVGVYAVPDEIAWRSVLANGAAIFAYRISDKLSIGMGAGLTNSYGVPMVVPMGYLSWRTNGDIKVQIDMASGMTVKASTMFGKTIGLELTAIDIDGMSAVRHINGETKIYSTMMMRSSLSPTVQLSKAMKLKIGIGGIWLRSSRMTNRSLKDFFKSYGDDEGKYHFCPAFRLSVGVSYRL